MKEDQMKICNDETAAEKWKSTFDPVTFDQSQVPYVISFQGGSKLTLNPDGTATFEGNADDAAQQFFDNVIKLHNQQYQALEKNIEYERDQKKFAQEMWQSDSKFGAEMTEYSMEQSAEIMRLEEIRDAAEKLVRCKGRYHSEQNYRALAALFGVTTPDLPPLGEQE